MKEPSEGRHSERVVECPKCKRLVKLRDGRYPPHLDGQMLCDMVTRKCDKTT